MTVGDETTDYGRTRSAGVSEAAVGGYVFAGVILIMVGCFQAIAGLAATLRGRVLRRDAELHLRIRHHDLGLDPPAPGTARRLRGIRALRCQDLGARGRR